MTRELLAELVKVRESNVISMEATVPLISWKRVSLNGNYILSTSGYIS